MTRVFVWPPNEDTEVPDNYIGVAIEKLPDGGWHTAVLYRTSQKGPNVLHLTRHYGDTKQKGLINENPQTQQLCVLCAVEDVQIPAITRVFRKIYTTNKNPGLPYGFTPPLGDWFDADGRLVPTPCPPGRGLCCQTFVLAAYQAADFPLIAPPEAPSRPGDLERQRTILDRNSVALSEASTRTKEHFAVVEANLGAALYRPLEVAGAAKAGSLPCSFAEAQANASELEPLIPALPALLVVASKATAAVSAAVVPESPDMAI